MLPDCKGLFRAGTSEYVPSAVRGSRSGLVPLADRAGSMTRGGVRVRRTRRDHPVRDVPKIERGRVEDIRAHHHLIGRRKAGIPFLTEKALQFFHVSRGSKEFTGGLCPGRQRPGEYDSSETRIS